MSTCPDCQTEGTYVSHASAGLRTCNGCEDNICTECFYGSRYCCAYLSPPTTPVSRQCSEQKWKIAEETLRNNPDMITVIADCIPGEHLYTVSRSTDGTFVREHTTTVCVKCGCMEIPCWESDEYTCWNCYNESLATE